MAIFLISHSHIVRDILMTTCKLRDFDIAAAHSNSSTLNTLDKNTVIVLHTGRDLADVETQITHLYSLCKDIRIMLIAPEVVIDALRIQFATQVHAIMPEDDPTEALIGALAVLCQGYSVVTHPPETISPSKSKKPSVGRNSDTPIAPPDWVFPDETAALSPRENAVLIKLRDGGSNKDIANALGICEATVKVYLRTCFQKIGVKNRTQAAVWASGHL